MQQEGLAEIVAREIGHILTKHGQVAARAILREAILRVWLNDGLVDGKPAGPEMARRVIAELEAAPEPLLI